ADGMGGHLGGEVASLTAIEALRANFDPDEGAQGLEQAIIAANEAVVALVDTDDEGLLAVANIGDSRIYLMRNGELSQLTDDHSLPEELFRRGQLTKAEAAVDPRRNIVTRVLGPSFGEGPDIQNLVPYVGDRILICSDGLYNEVDDDGIATVLRTVDDPTNAARMLVEQANAHGGADNISVVIVDVVDDDGRAETASEVLADEAPAPRAPSTRRTRDRSSSSGLMTSDERNAELRRLARDDGGQGDFWEKDSEIRVHDTPSRRVTGRVVAFLLLLLLVLGGAGAAVGFYARGSYFVGLDEGRVAIFKGRPGGLLWFSPTVEERTRLTEAAVPEARADDVRNGHTVASLDEAHRYVANLVSSPSTTEPALDETTTTTAVPETTSVLETTTTSTSTP
ncbi:MAG TPA: hypothetical protein VM143_06925, partial [Acidimicrobiales bacterium]|nr:hypothetical protein [Acidimicrobiales bacterium]